MVQAVGNSFGSRMVQAVGKYAMGIDLGTTNSCVAVYLPDSGQVEIVANRLGKNTTPSCIGFTANGRIVVGERARNCRPMIYDAKRMIG